MTSLYKCPVNIHFIIFTPLFHQEHLFIFGTDFLGYHVQCPIIHSGLIFQVPFKNHLNIANTMLYESEVQVKPDPEAF